MLTSKSDVPKYQILRREDLISPGGGVKSFNESVSQPKGPAKQKGQKQRQREGHARRNTQVTGIPTKSAKRTQAPDVVAMIGAAPFATLARTEGAQVFEV
jgi:hypothetical protein